MIAMASPASPKAGNLYDREYWAFLNRIQTRLSNLVGVQKEPLFTTDARGLWRRYVDSFLPEQRQFHACSACRRFVEAYGGLVTIDPSSGKSTPVFWDIAIADLDHRLAVHDLSTVVAAAPVTGVFLTSSTLLGTPVTGPWRHLGFHLSAGVTQTAEQKMAEKRQDFVNVRRALGCFSLAQLDQVVALLKSDALYRAEKVLGPARWLRDLKQALSRGSGYPLENIIWRAIATAPAGFCHPRSSMIGTLLDDLAAGYSFDASSRRFAQKMNPTVYQRPTAPPTDGNIDQAERILAELRAQGSLARRFATLDEVVAIWRPRARELRNPTEIFAHLRQTLMPRLEIPRRPITWTRLVRDVLPAARRIELEVPPAGNFVAIVTAVNASAPSILQWGHHFSWYVYPTGSLATSWSLVPTTWTAVTSITLQPSQWFGDRFPHHGASAIFLLEGARDLCYREAGAGLFPEILKAELHPVRATIEAYSRRALIEWVRGRPLASGIKLPKTNVTPLVLRIDTGAGIDAEYVLDRWE